VVVMHTREVALMGCLIPIFLVLEEIAVVSPVPVSVFLVYLFKDAKMLSVYAVGIASFIAFTATAIFVAANMIILVLVIWNVTTDALFLWYMKRTDLDFSNRALWKVGWLWTLIPLGITIFVMPIQFSIHAPFITLLSSIVGLLFGYVIMAVMTGMMYQITFNVFREKKLDSISERINKVLVNFLSFGTEVKELQMKEVVL